MGDTIGNSVDLELGLTLELDAVIREIDWCESHLDPDRTKPYPFKKDCKYFSCILFELTFFFFLPGR